MHDPMIMLNTRLPIVTNGDDRVNGHQTGAQGPNGNGSVTRPAADELRSIIDTAHEAFVSMDDHGRVTYWNPQAERTFGWSREEAMGQGLAEMIIPEANREAHRRGLKRFLASGKGKVLGRRLEMTALHRDGREFPVELTLSAIARDGRWTFNAFLHDITERKHAEEALRKREVQLAQAQNIARIGSWEWDLESDVVSWSDELHRIFGVQPDNFEASYAAFVELVHPDDRGYVEASIRRALDNRSSFELEHRVVRPDGELRTVHCRGETVRDDTGVPLRLIGTCQDVTEQKRLEEHARLAREFAIAIGEAETVEAGFELVLRTICKRTGWALGQVWTRNGGPYLECGSAHYLSCEDLEPFREGSKSMTFEPGVGLPGCTWVDKRPVWVKDIGTEPNFPRAPFAREVGLRAGMAVPVLAKNDVVAVMEFFVFEHRDEDERLIALVSSAAAHLGSLIERKQAEEALRKSEECFRSLVESFDDHLVCMLDSSGHITSWNQGAERTTGYRADEIIGYHISRFYTAEAVQVGLPERHLELAAARGRYEESEWRARKDGLRFWANVIIAPLRSSDGEVRGFSHVAHDVTERKLFDEELQRLGAVVENSEDAIFSTAGDMGIITSWNRGAERLFGYTAREVVGRSIRLIVPPERTGAQAELRRNVLEGRRVEDYETQSLRKNGSKIDVSLTVSPVKDPKGAIVGVSAIARNITGRKRDHQALERAFGTYLDRTVADHILREGASLTGEEVDVTMMFVDIRGFTAFAERCEPTDVVATLNCLFELAVPIITRHGGQVDKFVGDGLLAVFGAPKHCPEHACSAVKAALEIDRRAQEEFEGDLEIGIGVDSGSVVVGNVGGGGRFDFTVIGNAVNMAARIESATRQTGDRVLISEETKRRIGACGVTLDERRGISLKGRSEPLVLFTPRLADAPSL